MRMTRANISQVIMISHICDHRHIGLNQLIRDMTRRTSPHTVHNEAAAWERADNKRDKERKDRKTKDHIYSVVIVVTLSWRHPSQGFSSVFCVCQVVCILVVSYGVDSRIRYIFYPWSNLFCSNFSPFWVQNVTMQHSQKSYTYIQSSKSLPTILSVGGHCNCMAFTYSHCDF